MGCSVYSSVFEVSCKHLLCVECIKSPCKMCEFINTDEEKIKSTSALKKLSDSEKCFLCKKPNNTIKKRECGHFICNRCTNVQCCVRNSVTLPAPKIGTCEMCKQPNVAIQNKKCKHWRCRDCENLPCVVPTNQNNIESILMGSILKNTCMLCNSFCVGVLCEECGGKL